MMLSEIEEFEKKVQALEASVAEKILSTKQLDIQICAARMNGRSDDEIRHLVETSEICKSQMKETENTLTQCRTKLGIARLEEMQRLANEERSWIDKVKSFFFTHP